MTTRCLCEQPELCEVGEICGEEGKCRKPANCPSPLITIRDQTLEIIIRDGKPRSWAESDFFLEGETMTIGCKPCLYFNDEKSATEKNLTCTEDGSWSPKVTGCFKPKCNEISFDENSVLKSTDPDTCREDFKCKNQLDFLEFDYGTKKVSFQCTQRY